MSISKRLFIGNIHSEVQESELKTRFSNFGTVHSVEIRSKNSDYFAFMNIEFVDSPAMKKCFDVLNNTKWNGLTLKVQYAKESFLEKLKRERNQQGQNPDTTTNTTSNGFQQPRSIRHYEKPKKPDNFDFEIVSANSKPSDRQPPAPQNSVQLTPEVKPEKKKTKEKVVIQHQNFTTTEHKSKSNLTTHVDQKDEVDKTQKKFKTTKIKTKKKKVVVTSDSSNSDSADTDESSIDEKDGIPRFRGLAAFANSFPTIALKGSKTSETEAIKVPILKIETKPKLEPAPEFIPFRNEPTKFKLNLNPHKKAKSDEQRLKSLSMREELSEKRSKLIRSSLLKVEVPSTILVGSSDDTKKTNSNDFLFVDDPEEESEISFKVKPQYEGTSGQEMLKLKSTYGNDKRFQLDERFAESKNKVMNIDNSEKEVQLEILQDLFGPLAPITTTTTSKSLMKDEKKSLRFLRFDPTLDAHKIYIQNLDEIEIIKEEKKTDDELRPKSKKRKKLEETKAIEEEKAKLKDPDVKSSFKVAENLKILFNNTESEASPSTFSFLQTFGNPENKDLVLNISTDTQEMKNRDFKPRDVWKKNPFKYDSSDDEDEKSIIKVKKSLNVSLPVETKNSTQNCFKQDLFGKEKLFFNPNDERLRGIFKEFLSSTENSVEINEIFNGTGRSELKAIARSKLKNSKRKSEKKIKVMRLIRKKKRRDAMKKQENYELRKTTNHSRVDST